MTMRLMLPTINAALSAVCVGDYFQSLRLAFAVYFGLWAIGGFIRLTIKDK